MCVGAVLHVCAPHVCLWRLEEDTGSLELEESTFVMYPVDVGNQMPALWRATISLLSSSLTPFCAIHILLGVGPFNGA